MMSFSFWQRWLLVIAVALTAFGVVMAFVSGTPVFDVFNSQINPAFWGAGAVEGPAKQFQQWVYGLWGATIAGWGIFITYVARYPFARRERWAWNCLALGIGLWYVLDTGLSLAYGVYFNVAFNTVLLIAAGVPLAFTRSEFP